MWPWLISVLALTFALDHVRPSANPNRQFFYNSVQCHQNLSDSFGLSVSLWRSDIPFKSQSPLECLISRGNQLEYDPTVGLQVYKLDDESGYQCHLLGMVHRPDQTGFHVWNNDNEFYQQLPFCTMYFLNNPNQSCAVAPHHNPEAAFVAQVGPRNLFVLCDLQTEEGGWTIFQRRRFGGETFNRGWYDYRLGFGSLSGDFWLGLENINSMELDAFTYELRVDMTTVSGIDLFAKYATFFIDAEAESYRGYFGTFSGTAGNGLALSDGEKFQTFDKESPTSLNCSTQHGGGFWFWAGNCGPTNPNGVYGVNASNDLTAIMWPDADDVPQTLSFIEFKMRPVEPHSTTSAPTSSTGWPTGLDLPGFGPR